MKAFFVIVMLFLTVQTVAAGTTASKSEKIQQAVERELELYPHSTLVDLYKSFFQGAFGPGHMIPDMDAARNYLQHELRQSTTFDTVLWQPVGYREQFYRINLKLVHDGHIPADTLLAAFVESANNVEPPPSEVWRAEWADIAAIIDRMALDLAEYISQKAQLDSLLAAGQVAVHHSEHFHAHYAPHYRIVSARHFEDLMRRFLHPLI